MKKLVSLLTMLCLLLFFAFSVQSFSADEVDPQETTALTSDNSTNIDDFYESDISTDDEYKLATDDELAYSSGNPTPKDVNPDRETSMTSPETGDIGTYSAVALALLFGSIASVVVYKLKR